jgi:hypothetical protein
MEGKKMNAHVKIVAAISAFLYVLGVPLTGQTPFLKITSPPNGALVRPRDRVTVLVDGTPSVFRAVYLMPFLVEAPPSGPPYRFAFQVPSDGASGDLEVEAIGVLMSGYDRVTKKGLVQDILVLDFERLESPKRLTCELWDSYNGPDGFHHVGEIRQLLVTGIFAGGADVVLSRSKLTKYESSSPSIVKVDPTGQVTAVGYGFAMITVKNGNATVEVPTTVPVE